MKPKYDLHLSIYRVSQATINSIEKLGFTRDEFANNRYCDTTVYHGTYNGTEELPSDNLWNKLESIFIADETFIGSLEEEESFPEYTYSIKNSALLNSLKMKNNLPSFPSYRTPAGVSKACDIHINFSLENSSEESIKRIEELNLASFDKPQVDGIHRIFSITCETIIDGQALFKYFQEYLTMMPNIDVKLKFEATRRFLRIPKGSPVLPIANSQDVRSWLKLSENTRENVII
jgi:hypothetical protein